MIFKTINRDNHSLLNTGRSTILFFHPTCIHCIMMRKEWEKMKEELKKRRRNCNIYEVNGEELHDIPTPLKSHVDGFPTIMNVENGHFKGSFQDERVLQKMLKFAEDNENLSRKPGKKTKSKKTTSKRRVNKNSKKKVNKKKRKTKRKI